MSDHPGVTEGAASLLDVDPALSPVLGARAAAAIGHRPVLPVLTIGAGPWAPPARAPLGAGTVALVVLGGLLLRETAHAGGAHTTALVGPGDLVDPWRTVARWTACTPVRMAVIGRSFMEAMRPWPRISARLLERESRQEARHAALAAAAALPGAEDRLLAILWHLAARWGLPAAGGVVLPLPLDLPTLGRLAAVPDSEMSATVNALRGRGAALGRRDGTWMLPTAQRTGPWKGRLGEADLAARRHDLRSQVAQQLARAREAHGDCAAVCVELERRLRERERSPQRA